MNIQSSIQYVKGVGPHKVELFQQVGIQTVEDIFYYFPLRYEDRSHLKKIKDICPDSYETVQGEVFECGFFVTPRRRMSVFKVVLTDGTGFITAIWFNQPYVRQVFKKRQNVILYGRVEFPITLRHGTLQMNNPEYEFLTNTSEDTMHMGRIVPIYSTKKYLSQRLFRSVVKKVLDASLKDIADFLPKSIISYNRLAEIKSAIQNIHFPEDFRMLADARKRLVFDEFFILQMGLGIRKNKYSSIVKGIFHKTDGAVLKKVLSSLPFNLTDAQEKVFKEIKQDLSSPKPMHRLLQGDVGSGKTVIAILALCAAADGGYQSAIMVPTEILAQQHYNRLKPIFEGAGIHPALLISGMTEKAKQAIRDKINSGEINIIIGTHSLIQDKTIFKRLGLVIIDEQHKFGVAQRKILATKGNFPDILIMTATPIPRTLALTLYGDLDISILDELPPGRHPVKTYWTDDKKRDAMYGFLKEKMLSGERVYVVYPLIEKSEKMSLRAAENMYKEFLSIFKDFKVGLVHGKMSSIEKASVMKKFEDGHIKMLVSTTVLEVGIDVPQASVMIVEHADRFGLSQLHQLRGRVGRGSVESYCILLSDAKSENARKRLQSMVETNNGFQIAEKDLSIRGPGEFFGSRQHGFFELKIGNLVSDIKILEQSRNAVSYVIKKDPNLVSTEFSKIKDVMLRKFSGGMDFIG